MTPRRALWLVAGLGLAALVIAAIAWMMLQTVVETVTSKAPPRAAPMLLPPPTVSSIGLPVRVPLALLQKTVNDAVPATLWAIDEADRVCVPSARMKLFKARVKVTPDIKCHIIGRVKRGPIRLTGAGEQLRLAMPLSAEITARDIGGIIPHETATATALVTADLRPSLTADGHLGATIHLAYDWRQEPGVMLMGRRIRLTEKVDQKLGPILQKAQVDLSRKLAALPVRSELERTWRSGFTVESLNRRNPQAWLRLTPQGFGVGRIAVEREQLRIDAVLDALAEVQLGAAPPRPEPTPLPLIAAAGPADGLTLNVAVLSDYATLEAVIGKALAKVAAKGIDVPDYGRVRVQFRRVILYGTEGGRLALGLDLRARGPHQVLNTRGRVWLTARAETLPDSEQVLIRDVRLFTAAGDDAQLPLLVAVARSDAVRTAVETALAQDFSRDYKKLMAKIDRALMAVPVGKFRLSAQLQQVRHGKVLALGQGLYMPVQASGTAQLDYAGPR